MTKLVYVNRGIRHHDIHLPDFHERLHDLVHIQPERDIEAYEPHKAGQFFWIDDRDVNTVVRWLCKKNPGCEVKVFNLESVSECPAADMVQKKVTADGVLPVME